MSFALGDRVTKVTGDYSFDGVVVAEFNKVAGQKRYVVEDERGALHIYSDTNLRHIGNSADHQYLRIMHKLLTKGDYREGRNGGVFSLFGEQMRFDLSEGFPLLTTKKVHFKSIVVELLWFLKGDTNIKYLHNHGVTIWDEWADENGDLGPVYGKQWRSWETNTRCPRCYGTGSRNDANLGDMWKCEACLGSGNASVDQIQKVILSLIEDPYSRRHIVSAWNPSQVDSMALPPCHCLFQFHVTTDGKLNCHLYQRSADWFLGVPFNIASYALLTILMARETGLTPGEFVHSFGDLHLYENHVEQAKEQLAREPRALPNLRLAPNALDIFSLKPEDIELHDYDPHPLIKAPVSA